MSIPAHQAEQIMAVLERDYEANPVFRAVVDAKSLTVVCAYCKRVRTDGVWHNQTLSNVAAILALEATHSACPDCLAIEEAKINAAPVASLHAKVGVATNNPTSTGGASTPFSPVSVHTSVAPGVTVALGAEGEA